MRKPTFMLGCFLLLFTTSNLFAQAPLSYQTVPNDPMQSRIYTLSNGMKVYLTVNKQEPRIQTYVAVHVGGKNDPAETTGLSHYLEHLLFKGTTHFGTSNYAAEKPLLDQIRQLYEVYRHTTDSLQRRAIYHQIDSISYEASRYSIPNEYDKLMTSIGSKNSNAYTSEDCTVYEEDIPSNQIENWAKVQSERFTDAVIRGFHTELEAVYEEFNIGLTQDERKLFEAINKDLYPNHPYGKQTVIGTQAHLKNPSIVNIDNHFHTYYVANNMAICMSGDLNPDSTIKVLEKYFSALRQNPNLPKMAIAPEKPIEQPIVTKIYGQQAAMVALAWRFPGERSLTNDTLQIASMVLSNGQAGLVDDDITLKQKMVEADAFIDNMADHSSYIMCGLPKEGQTLDQVKELFLQEVEKLKKGQFSEDLLHGAINNFKLRQMRQLENNAPRASMFVESFTKDIPWAQQVGEIDRMSRLTKADIVAFANRHFGNNYAVVYKEVGNDSTVKKIDKPVISPILTNRDKASEFLLSVQKSTVKPIEPVFLDFKKDLSVTTTKSKLPVIYKMNNINGTFMLEYLNDRGTTNDKYLGLAFSYLDYIGTPTMSSSQFNKRLYALGCHLSQGAEENKSYVIINGLSENMKAATDLVENLMAHAVVDKEAYEKMVDNYIKGRNDEKLDQRTNFSQLVSYVTYNGQKQRNVLSDSELRSLNPQILVDKIHHFLGYKHRILYYGPQSENTFVKTIETTHHVPTSLKPLPAEVVYKVADTKDNVVYLAPYEAKNIYLTKISSYQNNTFDVTLEPSRSLYNEYFGGSMNSIVFQDLRESRALAYSARASYSRPERKTDAYIFNANIITQNDKAKDALSAYQQILDDMPVVQANFDLAKQGLLSQLRTNRKTGRAVFSVYLDCEKLGLTSDPNKYIFDKVQNMTLDDVVRFQQQHIKGIHYHTAILGNEKDLNMNEIAKYGTIKRVTQSEIFGF